MTEKERSGDRIAKLLARAGVASRREIERMIADGRVALDGKVLDTPAVKLTGLKGVTVDGKPVEQAEAARLFAFHKPSGLITAERDPRGRPTIYTALRNALPKGAGRVMPVGRLDFNTEGLLLLTNDGELAHRLTHPSYGVEKEYVAEVEGTPSRAALRMLREGVELDDGMTAPAKASLMDPSVVRLTIHEGRNRQVRRMCAEVGHPVTRLVRVRVGPIADRSLAPGAWRELTVGELRSLQQAVATKPDR